MYKDNIQILRSFSPKKMTLIILKDFFFILLCCFGSASIAADNSSFITVEKQMKHVMKHHDLVGLGIAIADSSGKSRVFVNGVRRSNSHELIELSDSWHIGSNTKALTALLFARLVDKGIASWEQPIADYFPKFKSEIDPAWTKITIKDLFSHRSGLGQLGPTWILPTRLSDKSAYELRSGDARDYLTVQPDNTVGEFKYSSLNYIIAGAAIESLLAEKYQRNITWESAMQEHVFSEAPNPKARNGWGFGPPEHIEGHKNSLWGLGSLVPVGKGQFADNPPSFGPAGTLHVPLEPHVLLLAEFLKHGSDFMSVTQRQILLSAFPDNSSDYGFGWKIETLSDYGTIYWHSGSNNMWFSYVIIIPEIDRVVIINTNRSGKKRMENAFKKLALDVVNSNLLAWDKESSEPE